MSSSYKLLAIRPEYVIRGMKGDELNHQEAARKLTERFWTAVKARDAVPPGTPERERAERVANRLAQMIVDFDQRGTLPDSDELDGLDVADSVGETGIG